MLILHLRTNTSYTHINCPLINSSSSIIFRDYPHDYVHIIRSVLSVYTHTTSHCQCILVHIVMLSGQAVFINVTWQRNTPQSTPWHCFVVVAIYSKLKTSMCIVKCSCDSYKVRVSSTGGGGEASPPDSLASPQRGE